MVRSWGHTLAILHKELGIGEHEASLGPIFEPQEHSDEPTLNMQSLVAINRLLHPDSSADNITPEEMQLVIAAIQSDSITAEELRLGKFINLDEPMRTLKTSTRNI